MDHTFSKNTEQYKSVQTVAKITDTQVKAAYEYNKIHQSFLSSLGQPLRDHYGCDLVAYFRFYSNDNMIFLTTNDKWCDYTFKHQNWLPPQDALYGLQKALENGEYYFIWPSKPDNKEAIYLAYWDHSIWNGMTIIKKYYDCLEAYCFASSAMSEEITDLYLNHHDIFERFILYFRDKTANIMESYNFNRFFLISPIQPFINKSDCDINFHYYIHKILTKHHHLRVHEKDIILSQQEISCLSLLSKGKSIKEIACDYNISPRTVETYLGRIINKTSYSTKSQLIALYHDSCSTAYKPHKF